MTEEELIKWCKTSAGISTTAYDENEIKHLIEALKTDITEACGSFDLDNANECRLLVIGFRANFGEGDAQALATYQSVLKEVGIRQSVRDKEESAS